MIRRRHLVPAWVMPILQIGVTVALLVTLWRVANGPGAVRALAGAQWPWLGAAIVALTVQTILSALRWQLSARQLGIVLGTGCAIREYYLAQVVNQSLPGGMIGDAGRAVRARGQAGLLASGQAVVFERLAGQVAMFITLGLAFTATLAVPGGLDWPGWLIGPVMVLLAAALLTPVTLWGVTRLPGAAGRGIALQWQALHKALLSGPALPGQITLSLGTTLCNLAAFALCARAVGVNLSLPEVTALVPLILVTMMIPLSISGWGLREGAAAALLPIAGVSASDALAASVAFGLVFAVSVLPGLVLVWRKPRAATPKTGRSRPYRQESATSSQRPALPNARSTLQ